MKNYLISCALLTGLTACISDWKPAEKKYLSNIGDTEYFEDKDQEGFQPCHPDLAFQYYNFGQKAGFSGEKTALDRYFRENYKAEPLQDESGYFTVRFIVNCEGKTAWFRTEAMDLNYQPTKFKPSISDQLLQLTKELKGWKVAGYEEEKFDYYQYLTFKIENGQLLEILP